MRGRWFVFGLVFGAAAVVASGYAFVKAGGVSMATTARPLPFERVLAAMALHASIGDAAQDQDPLGFNEANLRAGADAYRTHCAMCHGLPGQPAPAISEGMFPRPPQLLEPDGMVTDDPEGVTHWKVTHGIRLSGMPAFERILSDTERWQVTMLTAHADALPPDVKAALGR
jgi:thiosulfate dehydrogenase